MDFFTVPTLTFKVLYCFFIIRHDRHSIVHFNVTRPPRAVGSYRRCAKPSPISRRLSSSFLTTTRSMDWEAPAAIRSTKIGCVQTSI